ncbi:MAG: RluA family pseudouridine synthase [Bacteriovoracaceae bacterium]
MTQVSRQYFKDRFVVTITVQDRHEGVRLDQFMVDHFGTISRQYIKKKIASGEIIIVNRPVTLKSSVKVHYGEVVKMEVKNVDDEVIYWRGDTFNVSQYPEVLFNNEHVAVVDKPPYMATHPTGRHLFNCVTVYLADFLKKNVHSVHRIDRETSGILILAKSVKVASILTNYFEARLVRKVYFFIGVKNEQYKNPTFPFIANERIRRNDDAPGLQKLISSYHDQNSQEGKKAQTEFNLLYENEKYIVGLACPKTGRQHQIRVHALANGFPLLGDKLYIGGADLFSRFKDNLATDYDHELMEIARHALHAVAINFPDKYLEDTPSSFMSKIPSDLEEWLVNKLNLDIVEINHLMHEKIKAYFNA